MKKYLTMALAGVICIFMFSNANADDMRGKYRKDKYMMMNEHHQFIDDILLLIKDMSGTMKDISADGEIKAKTDEYSKRVDELLLRHNKMKEKMSGEDMKDTEQK